MAQFARPSTDTTRDNWETQAGGTTNIYLQIDESVADDNDYIRTVLTPTNDVYVTKLTSVTDPVSSSNHTIRYRYGKNASAGDQIDLTVQLRQGYTNEGALGTLIKEIVHTNIGGFPVATSTTLSAGEADSITNYADLYLRFVGNKP
jgi:hypothetical protein